MKKNKRKNSRSSKNPPDLSRSDKRKIGALIGVIVLATVLLIVYITRDTGQRIVEKTDDPNSEELIISEEQEEEESILEADQEISLSLEDESDDPFADTLEETSSEDKPNELEERGKDNNYKPEVLKEPNNVATEISVRPQENSSEDETNEEEQSDNDQSKKFFGKKDKDTDKKDKDFSNHLGYKILESSAYDRQKVGNAPVYFYQHPSQSMGIDLRSVEKEASNLFVLPTEKGFIVLPRQILNLKNWSVDELIQKLNQGENIPGLVDVRLTSEREANEIKADNNRESIVETTGDGRCYVFSRDKEMAWMIDSLLSQMGEKAIDPKFVQNVFSPDGLIGRIEPVQGKDPLKEFQELKDQLSSNPAKVEWDYLLPLCGPGNYVVGARDLREIIPQRVPIYNCGVSDLDDDGNLEFIVHARPDQGERSGMQGYYAILTPSPTGLITSEVIPHGNGPLIKNGKSLLTASESKKEGITTLHISQVQYPMSEGSEFPVEVHFLHPKGLGHSISGKRLAKLYPDHYLVPHNGQLYLVPMADYDMLMDFAVNKLSGGREVFLKDADDPQSFPAQKITDPVAYLASKFPDLPFSQEDWAHAQPAKMFQANPMPISYEELMSGDPFSRSLKERTEEQNSNNDAPLPDDPMNPALQ